MNAIRSIILYGFAEGISRGSSLIILPLIVKLVSLRDFGFYTLCIIAIQLLSQAVSLGGIAAVIREGSESSSKAIYYATRFSLIALGIGVTLSSFIYQVGNSYFEEFYIVPLLAAHEALHRLFLAVTRCENKAFKFLIFSLIKAILWIMSILIIVINDIFINLENLLIFQLAVNSIVSIIFLINVCQPLLATGNLTYVLGYCIPTIAHSFAQWVINSIDKIILERLFGSEKLGFYSIAYSIASILLLVTSALAIYLPKISISDYIVYRSIRFRKTFLRNYTLIMLLIFIINLIAITIDYTSLNLLKYYDAFTPSIIGFVSAGFLQLGFYYYYCCFHIRKNQTTLLAKQTLATAFFSLPTTIIFCLLMDTIGAAIATWLTYVFYLWLVKNSALTMEKGEGKWTFQLDNEEKKWLWGTSILMIGSGLLLSFFWLKYLA